MRLYKEKKRTGFKLLYKITLHCSIRVQGGGGLREWDCRVLCCRKLKSLWLTLTIDALVQVGISFVDLIMLV